MKKLLLTFIMILAAIQLSNGQEYFEESQEDTEDEAPVVDPFYFGGGFGFNLFGDFKFLNVSPIAGYRFTPEFSMGVGISYLWLERDFNFQGQPSFSISSSQFGGRIFGRRQIDDIYFAQAEFESISVELGTGIGNETEREWVPGLFLGGGMMTPFFANSSINITVLYNFLHDNFKSPYGSAVVVRGGIVL